jgi:hypothetical protein
MSERYARSAHGQEVVDQALQAAVQAGATEFFRTRQDPYGEMVNWFRGQQLSQEIGSDPVAYRAKIEAELTTKVQNEVLARLQAGRTPPTNLPPSLAQGTNAAAATAQVVPDGRSFFSSMMSKRPSQ